MSEESKEVNQKALELKLLLEDTHYEDLHDYYSTLHDLYGILKDKLKNLKEWKNKVYK